MNKKVSASAPGKVILFGEHAVVYGRPAIAVPVTQVQATATVQPGARGLTIHASDLSRTITIDPHETTDPLAVAVVSTLRYLEVGLEHNLTIRVESTIPLGRGFGSSAAVSAAMVRALARYFDVDLPPGEVSRLVYQTEIIHHGTPSGVDNTVIAHARPVY
ncbi:MAG: mevalonate kinase, partial [Chloroflexi bacterium]